MVHIENVARHRLRMDLEKRHVRRSRIEGNTLGASLLRAACLCQRHRHINRFPRHAQRPAAGLHQHGIVLFPSAVPRFSWKLMIDPSVAKGRYRQHSQARFVLETRRHPPLP